MKSTNNEEQKNASKEYFIYQYQSFKNMCTNKIKNENLISIDNINYSFIDRMRGNVRSLFIKTPKNRNNIITSCFKVTYEEEDDVTNCIYSFLYSHWDKHHKKIVHDFISTGPTYYSQDGEFRGRFIEYDQMEQLYEKFSDIMENIDSHIISKLDEGLILNAKYYWSNDFKYAEEYKKSIKNSRIPIKLYTLSWFVDNYLLFYKIIDNHVNPAYQYIVSRDSDLLAFENLESIFGRQYLRLLVWRIEGQFDDVLNADAYLYHPRCGQKLFTLNTLESSYSNKIHSDTWREIYITQLATNLVLNLISPGFPFIIDWFYINGADLDIFDNVKMHEKYLLNDGVDDLLAHLLKSNEFLKKEELPIGGKYRLISDYIRESVVTAKANIKISDTSLCMLVEHVGRTLFDLPTLVYNVEVGVGMRESVTVEGSATRVLFEYCYAVCCLNIRQKIIHTDLHLNNLTINRVLNVMEMGKDEYFSLFILDKTPYKFRSYGLYGTVIDFSKAILGNIPKMESDFGIDYTTRYIYEQRHMMFIVLYNTFPAFTNENKEKLEKLFITNFSLAFKIFSAIDLFVLSKNMINFYATDKHFADKLIPIPENIIKVCTKINEYSKNLLMDNFRLAFDDKIIEESIDWPNPLIIKHAFKKYEISLEDAEKYKIVEIFNIENDMTNDITDFKKWGPFLSVETEIQVGEKYNIDMSDRIAFLENAFLKREHPKKIGLLEKYPPWMF